MNPPRLLPPESFHDSRFSGITGQGAYTHPVSEPVDNPFLQLPVALPGRMIRAMDNEHNRIGVRVPRPDVLDQLHAIREVPIIVEQGDNLNEAFDRCERSISTPVVVKPNHGGSTVGLVITSEREAFRQGVQAILEDGDNVLVERYIEGRELTVTMIDGAPYPLVEIVPKTGLYDYTRKYTKGETQYLCPAPVDEAAAAKAQELSTEIYRAVGCRHLARVDWRLTPEGHLVFLEVNTIPGMTDLSLVPMAAKATGMDFDALMARFVELVLV